MKYPTPASEIHSATVAAHLNTAALWVIGLSPAFFATVVWEKSSSFVSTRWGSAHPEVAISTWRLYSGALYAAVAIAILLAALVFALMENRAAARRTGRPLTTAALVVYSCPVISGVFGENGGAAGWRLWIPLLLLITVYLAPRIPLATLLRTVRRILRFYVWGSLTALALAPGWAVTPNFNAHGRLDWLLPGGRLAGLTTHPIALGVLAATALALEVASVHRSGKWRLNAAAAGCVLLMSQARTAWAAALVSLFFLYSRDASYCVHSLLKRGVILWTALCAALFVPAAREQLAELMSSDEVTTLHGRTLPWEAAVEAFHGNVWLGYGPTLFTDPLSPARGAFDHAHNQLLQSLGTAGLLGAAGLSLFVLVLVGTAARTARATAGLSYALTALVLVVCVPEAPLRGAGFSPYLVLVLVLFTVLLSALPADSAAEPNLPASDASPTIRVLRSAGRGGTCRYTKGHPSAAPRAAERPLTTGEHRMPPTSRGVSG